MSLSDLRIRSSEHLLIDALRGAEPRASSILCTSPGRGQLAALLAEEHPEASVACCFLDLYPAEEAHRLLAEEGRGVAVECSSDLPEATYDLVALPFAKGGERELTRDWLQQGFSRLEIGGVLYAAVDNPKDTWLHHEIEKLQKGLTRMPNRWGVVYRLVKKSELKRLRDFTSQFAFRDGERLVQLVTSPGVFSHRKLDLGARALLESMEVKPGMKVLDLGCGSGAVGIAAALRAPGVTVLAVDSNARAVQCAMQGAELNGVADRVSVQLDAEGSVEEPGTFDLVLGNPPYYSHYTIAELFLQTARLALKPGGRVQIVTKQAEWFEARMQQLFRSVEVSEARGYVIVSGRRQK
jgi:16S rRNA (guanine1207-N2)-methyltransferase